MTWFLSSMRGFSLSIRQRSSSEGPLPPNLSNQQHRCIGYIVVFAFALGAFIQLRQYLGCPSYWYDEAYALVNIYTKNYRELIGTSRCNIVCPPLYLWSLRGIYDLVGGSELAMRFPAIVCALVGMVVFYFAAKSIVGRAGACLAMILFAVSNHAMVHANEVRTYSIDFLMTALIVYFAAGRILSTGTIVRSRAHWGLLPVALLAPWVSFPSVLVFSSASAALFVDALQRKERNAWLHWLAMNGLLAISAASMWWLHARHLYYPGLHDHWVVWDGFPRDHSPWVFLSWTVRCLINIGDYATPSMGIPLLLLSLIGAVQCWRRSRAMLALLVGPMLVGWLAAVLGKYPMADRTLFFAAPCIWILGIWGVRHCVELAGTRGILVGVMLSLILVVPGAVRAGKYVAVVGVKCDFRSPLQYMDRRCTSDDLVWVSHPEMNEVYRPAAKLCLGNCHSFDQFKREFHGQRVWLVAPSIKEWTWPYEVSLPDYLESKGMILADHQRYKNMELALYVPKTGNDGSPTR